MGGLTPGMGLATKGQHSKPVGQSFGAGLQFGIRQVWLTTFSQ